MITMGLVTVTRLRLSHQQFEAVSQVAMADLLVLSKTDLVSPETANVFKARLNTLNPTACRLSANRGELPTDALANVRRAWRRCSAASPNWTLAAERNILGD